MKYFNKYFLVAAVLTGIVFTGCKKEYLDVNSDPNRVTDDNITPELIFTQAAATSAIRVVGGQAGGEGGTTDIQFVNDWMGYMSGTGDFALNGIETTYNIDFSFADNAWQRDYALLFDLSLAKKKALVPGGDTVLAAAAMILSAKTFQELVDTYGDIPYSQAFKNDEYKHPAYDAAQDIYNALQLSLDSAIIYMGLEAPASFAAVDIVNHGDQDKWIKFANTLKLRLLIRQSEVPGFNPQPEITKILNNGGVLGAGESVTVNPGYSNDQNKQSPFYGNYGYSTTGNIIAAGYAANEYIINILLSTNDARIERFFDPPVAGGNYTGCLYGLSAGNPVGSQASYFGAGLAGSASQDQWLYPSFESMFLEAEAIARGWIEGDPKTAFENAITESFVWLGVADAEAAAADYIATNDITNWENAGTTPLEQSRFVAYQKYIALCCIDPREAWADERRLHMLVDDSYISVNPGRLADTLPLRLLYAQSEYTTNGENVLKLGTINQFTTKIFWQP